MKGNLEELLLGAFVALPLPEDDIELDELENSRLKDFSASLDFQYLHDAASHAPTYRRMNGRVDPFNMEQLKGFVGDWSKLIDRPVITFYDAVDHALALCAMWVEEDSVLVALAEGKADEVLGPAAPPAPEVLDTTPPQITKEDVEAAKMAWKDAIKERDKAIEFWKDHVRRLHNRYIELRDK